MISSFSSNVRRLGPKSNSLTFSQLPRRAAAECLRSSEQRVLLLWNSMVAILLRSQFFDRPRRQREIRSRFKIYAATLLKYLRRIHLSSLPLSTLSVERENQASCQTPEEKRPENKLPTTLLHHTKYQRHFDTFDGLENVTATVQTSRQRWPHAQTNVAGE
jgi:hypothetical protein